VERSQTIRATLREELLRGPATARELSQRVRIREKDVAEHLEHLERSAKARGERLVVEPAACIACGHAFAKRTRFTRPGSCPSCGSTRIDPPAFRLEAERP
jgi:predicted Zn-ribbon and HTH transcriptional regulator